MQAVPPGPAQQPTEPAGPSTRAPAGQWKLYAILAGCAVVALGLLIIVVGVGAYVLTRTSQQPPAAQTAPIQPAPVQPAAPPQVPPKPAPPATAAGPGTSLTGHVYDADSGKAIILAYVAVLRPGTNPASFQGEKGTILALGGTTDTTGSFKTDPAVPKGAVYPVIVFNIDSNVITQYVNIPAGAPDVIDLGAFRLKMAHPQGTAPAAPASPQSMQHYTDPQGRFSIDYPDTWKNERPEKNALLHFINAARVTAVDLYVFTYTGGSQEAATQTEAEYRQKHPTVREVQGGPTRVAGRAAYYVYFTQAAGNADVYAIHVYVADGRQLYVFEGATLNREEYVRGDMPVVLQIIQSFRLR